MKKTIVIILIIVTVILSGFAYIFFIDVNGWVEFRKNRDTPQAYLNHTLIKKDYYKRDSIAILKQLKAELKMHNDFFHSKEYFDSTQIIIDTIIYSPDYNKLAVLVLAKNPTDRQLIVNDQSKWYFIATSYLALRLKDSIALSWIGPNFTNYTDPIKLSKDIREYYFRLFTTLKDLNGVSKYEYNLNDARFWSSHIWQELDQEKLKEKEFEEEKKNHPGNVYKPKQ